MARRYDPLTKANALARYQRLLALGETRASARSLAAAQFDIHPATFSKWTGTLPSGAPPPPQTEPWIRSRRAGRDLLFSTIGGLMGNGLTWVAGIVFPSVWAWPAWRWWSLLGIGILLALTYFSVREAITSRRTERNPLARISYPARSLSFAVVCLGGAPAISCLFLSPEPALNPGVWTGLGLLEVGVALSAFWKYLGPRRWQIEAVDIAGWLGRSSRELGHDHPETRRLAEQLREWNSTIEIL
jgi:hypothetical protein